MNTYIAAVTREDGYWVVSVDDLALAGQVRRLSDAEPVMRSIVAAALDVPEGEVHLELAVPVREEALSMMAQADRQEAEARTALSDARRLRCAATDKLIQAGLTQREVARALGLSPQRVGQLVHGQPLEAAS